MCILFVAPLYQDEGGQSDHSHRSRAAFYDTPHRESSKGSTIRGTPSSGNGSCGTPSSYGTPSSSYGTPRVSHRKPSSNSNTSMPHSILRDESIDRGKLRALLAGTNR